MELVRLLAEDPDLAAELTRGEAQIATRTLTVPMLAIPSGAWDPDALWRQQPRAFAVLLVDGILARDVDLVQRRARQLLGPGMPLPEPVNAPTLLPARIEWQALGALRVALLGEEWLRACARWPQLAVELTRRAGTVAARFALHQAISQLPRVEDRILGVLLHLGDAFGRMTADGVVLPLPLTHQELGRLVGARRPTVSLAVSSLVQSGALHRRNDGCWVLPGQPPADAPSTDGGPPAGRSAATAGGGAAQPDSWLGIAAISNRPPSTTTLAPVA